MIHRGQRPTPKPMPEPPQRKPPVAAKPPLQGQRINDPEKSVISNAASVTPSNVSRASSQSRRTDILKSNILSREEEARQRKEKKDKMDAIK